MKTTIICLAIFLALGLASCKENENNKNAEERNEAKFDHSKIEKDVDFAMKAGTFGLMGVQLGKIAVTNGSDDKVRQFGQEMIDDHTRANDQFILITASKNITLPTVPTQEQQKKIDNLREKSGEGFDYDYIDLMVKELKDANALYEKEGEDGNDTEIRSFAASMVSTLRHHLMMAEEIDNLQQEKKMKDKLNPQGMGEPRTPPRKPRTDEK